MTVTGRRLGGVLALAIWGWAAAAGADTFTVINGNDGGPGSFRSCINLSNKNGTDLDTIVCEPGATIVITRDAPPVQVLGRVVIEGRGATLTSSEPAANLLRFGPEAAGSTLSGLALYGGLNRLLVDGDGITVRDCRFGVDWAGAGTSQSGVGVLITGAHNRLAGNLIANNDVGVRIDGAGATGNALAGNTICAFATAGILLASGGNQDWQAPAVTAASPGWVSGTAGAAGDRIEVFRAENRAGRGGSLAHLGLTTAGDAPPYPWTLWTAAGPELGESVCALATGAENSSGFSENLALPTATPSPTPTVSPTATVTPTATISATDTPTSTVTPTATISATATPTPSVTPTATISATATRAARPDGLRAFPNPARARMAFLARPGARLTVYNAAGERVAAFTTDAGGAAVWTCGGVAPGVYWVRAEDGPALKAAVIR